MPAQDKPYRLYRGGRVKGRVPLARTSSPGSKKAPAAPSTAPEPSPPKRRRIGRWVALGLVLLLVLLIAWGVGSYLSVSSGVSEANDECSTAVSPEALCTACGV